MMRTRQARRVALPTPEFRRNVLHARLSAAVLTLAFATVAGLAAIGATRDVDLWMSKFAQSIAHYPLDVVASLFNILGQAEVTGPIALILAFVWWRRDGIRGLVPLLLFVGVALEVVLKHVVHHPGPPPELSRSVKWLPFLHATSPYSFPSGHELRVTFLAALMVNRWLFWGLTVAMAATRVYLNEHWASDVVGGFLLGLALAGLAASLYANPRTDGG